MTTPSLDAFLGSPVQRAPNAKTGNTQWAQQHAEELKTIIRNYSSRRARSLQKHLGPSELGVHCDRQVVGKLLGEPATNHVADPWPSFMGTAGHAEMENVFQWDNQVRYVANGLPPRWRTETKVAPTDEHPGTADLYQPGSVEDHKFLGDSAMAKLQSPAGPPRHYVAQLGLYGLGYLRKGLPVERAVLLAWPRTTSRLDDLYVWEKAFDASMVALIQEVLDDTKRRKHYAAEIQHGLYGLADVPRQPSGDECFFCPFYRPEAVDGGAGCPGTKQVK